MKTVIDVLAKVSEHVNAGTNITFGELAQIREILADYVAGSAAPPPADDFPKTVAEAQVMTGEEPPAA